MGKSELYKNQNWTWDTETGASLKQREQNISSYYTINYIGPFWALNTNRIYTPVYLSADQRLNFSVAEDPQPLTAVLKSTQPKSILGWQSADWNSTCGGTRRCQSEELDERATRAQHTHTKSWSVSARIQIFTNRKFSVKKNLKPLKLFHTCSAAGPCLIQNNRLRSQTPTSAENSSTTPAILPLDRLRRRV